MGSGGYARSREDRLLTTLIYVGNLSLATTEQDLQALFQPHGRVRSLFVPRHAHTGRGRGFAMVEMEDDAAALEAVRQLDGRDVGGQLLRVSARHDRLDGTGGRGYGR